MSRTQFRPINVIVSDAPVIEGKEYYFRQAMPAGTIGKGTAVRCEKCNKATVANSHTILSFPARVKEITVANELHHADVKELSHCDALDAAVCDACYVSSEE